MRTPAKVVAAAAAAAFVVAACSSSHPKALSSPTVPSLTTVAPATSVGAPTTGNPASTVVTPTTAGGPGKCTPATLKGSFAQVPGGESAGHVEAQVALTNTGGSVCTMFGYIGMQLLDASGRHLPTNVVRVPGAEQAVTLRPGASATVLAQYSADVRGAGDSTSGTCQPVAATTEVTPPDDTQSLVVQGPGTPVCQGGTIDVQPVQASAAAGQ